MWATNLYKHPEHGWLAIHAAVNPAVDPMSGQSESKHTPVEMRRLDMHWHGTILACRPVMLPEITCWARVKGAVSIAALGAVTRAGTNRGSCRPELRALLHAARPERAA
jgi:assimilatory nitrate reductase catalytic subunit